MVNEIRIYVEGGGKGKHTKTTFREGFSKFLNDIMSIVRSKHVRWHVIVCGPRNSAKENFSLALQSHPDAFNVLLVDSEGPVNNIPPWKYLQDSDGWDLQENLVENCQLMVQVMESWFFADVNALRRFYGRGFNENALPDSPDVEKISKNDVLESLKVSNRNTAKNEYHKIHHGPEILGLLKSERGREKAYHCKRLFTTLAEKVGETI